ncbi:merozoite surface protein 2-like isoform X2 [Atheta coriaria]|uniref:merozoite surface protein 2-like isoform X2 n=1 Tax=Dalotia coriaria TaxID=877792 RepID=UPI0031F42699
MMAKMNKCILMVFFCASMSFALPTVHFEKTVSTVGGGSSGGSGDIAVNFGGFDASAGSAGAGAGAGSSAAAFASASATATAGSHAGAGAGAGAAIVEKEITYGHKTIPQKTEIVAEKTFTEAPKVISEHTIQGQAQVQRTVIEKTVIPQYVEKTIQVPSYVEKTIRVPTVVEHKVRVPVTPKVEERTYEENAHASAGATAHAHAGSYASGKVQLQERPNTYANKQFIHKHGLFGLFHSGIRTNAASASSASASSGAYAGSSNTNAGNGGVQVQYKSGGGAGLIGNILNIPVATLGAVGNLFNSFGTAGGSVSINKNYRSY